MDKLTPEKIEERGTITREEIDAIQMQCAHFGGVPSRCLLSERNWSPSCGEPNRCEKCPGDHARFDLATAEMRKALESADRDDSKTRDAIGERFCLVPPDGGDVKTWEAAAEMRKALESAERDLAAALEREAEANRQLSMCRHEYDVNKRIWQSERDAALERVGRDG